MPKLAEVLRIEENALSKYALDIAAELEEPNSSYPKDHGRRFSVYQLSKRDPELSEAIVYAAWKELWKHAHPATDAKPPYTHYVPFGEATLSRIIPKLFYKSGLVNSKAQADTIRRQIDRALRANKVAERRGRGKAGYDIRYWHPSEHLSVLDFSKSGQAVRPDWRDEKRREEEEAKSAKTIVVKNDASIIKPPEGGSREDIERWIRRFIPAFVKTTEELNATRDALAKERAERDKLLEQIAQIEEEIRNSDSWTDIADLIGRGLRGEDISSNGG